MVMKGDDVDDKCFPESFLFIIHCRKGLRVMKCCNKAIKVLLLIFISKYEYSKYVS